MPRSTIDLLAQVALLRDRHGSTTSGAGAEVLAEETAGAVTRCGLADQEGSIRDVAVAGSGLVDHVVYGSFGQVLSESDPATTHWPKTGGIGRRRAVRPGPGSDGLPQRELANQLGELAELVHGRGDLLRRQRHRRHIVLRPQLIGDLDSLGLFESFPRWASNALDGTGVWPSANSSPPPSRLKSGT